MAPKKVASPKKKRLQKMAVAAKAKAKLMKKHGDNEKRKQRRIVIQKLTAVACSVGLETPSQNASVETIVAFLRGLRSRGKAAQAEAARAKLAELGASMPGNLDTLDGTADAADKSGEADKASGGSVVRELFPDAAEDETVISDLRGDLRLRTRPFGHHIKSSAFMLTYNSRKFTPDMWEPFRDHIKQLRRKFGARFWSACLEASLDARPPGVEMLSLLGFGCIEQTL